MLVDKHTLAGHTNVNFIHFSKELCSGLVSYLFRESECFSKKLLRRQATNMKKRCQTYERFNHNTIRSRCQSTPHCMCIHDVVLHVHGSMCVDYFHTCASHGRNRTARTHSVINTTCDVLVVRIDSEQASLFRNLPHITAHAHHSEIFQLAHSYQQIEYHWLRTHVNSTTLCATHSS